MILDSSTGYSRQTTISPTCETSKSYHEIDSCPISPFLVIDKYRQKGTSIAAALLLTCMTSQVLSDHLSDFLFQNDSNTSVLADFNDFYTFRMITESAMENKFISFLEDQIDADSNLIVPINSDQLQRIAQLIEDVDVE